MADVHHLTLEECQVRQNQRSGIQLFGDKVDHLSFVRCTIRDNKGPAVTGPEKYTALEWDRCTVAGNNPDGLPAPKPFPSASRSTTPR